MLVVKTKTYSVKQMLNTNSFILSLINNDASNKKNTYFHDIYESITRTKILSNAFLSEAENNESSVGQEAEAIMFTAQTVKPLSILLQKGKLTNRQTVKMIHDLSNQIAYLETNMLAFFGYNLEDILVINEDIYFIANTKHLLRMESSGKIESSSKNESKHLYFNNPIEKPYFSNPELNELTKLPSKIDYRASYYSLGALVLFCATNIYIFAELKEDNRDILKPIYYTKIYWFLRRCFLKDSKQRILLFI
jgi:hypothetical protein